MAYAISTPLLSRRRPIRTASGQTLQRLSADDCVISTKVGRYLAPQPSKAGSSTRTNLNLVLDYSYDATLRCLEQSLQRLAISRLDVVLISRRRFRRLPASFRFRAMLQAGNGRRLSGPS